MSLRRKSCVACFNGRRKCDLRSPICGRCARTQKPCHYIHLPQLMSEDTGVIVNEMASIAIEENTSDSSGLTDTVSMPFWLGELGHLTPVLGRNSGDQWVLERLRKCPQSFVTNLATFFIHRDMQTGRTVPSSLRSAFAASAASLHLNEHNQVILFQSIDSNVAQLLTAPVLSTLEQELARLQAMVLYQLIRLFSHDLRQRIVFESQEALMGKLCWQLLQHYSEAVSGVSMSRQWWILGESIRRTALTSYTLYGMYSYHKHGACLDLETLSAIPVSMDQTLWDRDDSRPLSPKEEMNWGNWVSLWHEVPRSPYSEFEKLLLVCCTGLEEVEIVESIEESLAHITVT